MTHITKTFNELKNATEPYKASEDRMYQHLLD